MQRPNSLRWWLGSLALAGGLACGAPYRPTSDAQVLERLPSKAGDPASSEIRALRQQLARDPANPEFAVRLVERHLALLAADGDPRHAGHAQAALAPWWKASRMPVDVRVQRAVLLQFNHQFAAAVADLDIALKEQPDHVQAWAWLAAIAMVQARYADAERACMQLAPLTSMVNAQACLAAAEGMSGRGAAAVARIQAALPEADDDAERLWALTRLAEIQERLGQAAEAERSYRAALALGRADQYLLAAYADFLLDQGRAGEVPALLKDHSRSDGLLLRLALAAKATGDGAWPRYRDLLAARFDAARLRGDNAHQKEEARFALQLLGDAPRALALARANFELQREAADARVLLEAAWAARDRAAAEPALRWRRESKVESATLARLAGQLEALP